MSLHFFVKYPCSKNRHAQEVIEANCHVRLSHLKTVLKYLSGKIFIIEFTDEKKYTPAIYKKSHYRPYTTAVTKKKMLQQNAVHDRLGGL